MSTTWVESALGKQESRDQQWAKRMHTHTRIFGGSENELWRKVAWDFRMLCRSPVALGSCLLLAFHLPRGRSWRCLVNTDAQGESLRELTFLLRKNNSVLRVSEKKWKAHCSSTYKGCHIIFLLLCLTYSLRMTRDPCPPAGFWRLMRCLAVTGSRLTIPCKVFLGAGIHTTTLLWWTANNTFIEDAYHGGRVTEGERQ